MSRRISLPQVSPTHCKVCYAADRDGNAGESASSGASEALLEPEEHVLSTLEADGSRRWLRPKLSMGEWWKRRRVVAYVLMVVFVAIPHLRVNGKPLILLDIAAREFTILGKTFYPTDTLVLALFMLSVFVSIVLITAITGRAWCGWACPQTVYMEFLFRPIDRFFEGTKGKGGKPAQGVSPLWQIARLGVYLLLCMFLAHTFLAYFVGTERLAQWVRTSPIEHPSAFLVMAGTTGLMLFDFLFFREQLCLIACPYGRFQSVMLDEQSKIVAYDPVRGEPRIKGKRTHDDQSGQDTVRGKPAGDCVDCHQCVVVCPTGIDIRDGLQMECINCTQCIDACDDVMKKVGKPLGLIRYSSQDAIARKPKKLLRARTIIYPIILVGVFSGLAMAISSKSGFDARILRGRGAPFTLMGAKEVSNAFNVRLVNRTGEEQTYHLASLHDEVEVEIIDEDKLTLPPGESTLLPIRLNFPSYLTLNDGNESIELQVSDQSDNERTLSIKVLGPRR
ncbi:cytochrome c oxidase accessory protein CcoG [Rhodopirellula sp. JC740]|uniref:Cytochrome c oxidase accessory protein CcoG n=1 Tax=Rhodopirellula halodulae TaxID=2894198 RepID=A0ABS8ND66_9BACT|nr:cytochrome c oxidase accessory protein CcoG [Rhodopirellula sp. JC740]MCC9641487.1 cytochrome c oxidase accessory protein CcoG [Rhodopirellula sp. JC740]